MISESVCPHCFGTGKRTDQVAFGAKMRSKRDAEGYTLKQLASLLGISDAYLCDLEYGKRNWTLELKTKADEIFKRGSGQTKFF